MRTRRTELSSRGGMRTRRTELSSRGGMQSSKSRKLAPPESCKRRRRQRNLHRCAVCLEEKVQSELYEKLACSHKVCVACLVKHVECRVEEGKASVRCVGERCVEVVTPESCSRLLAREWRERWQKLREVSCPYKRCGAPIDTALAHLYTKEVYGGSSLLCPTCTKALCLQCMVPWHSGLTCDEFDKLQEKSPDDLRLLELAHISNWQRCRLCKFIVYKYYGCDEMTCRCGYTFCYKCGEELRPGIRHQCHPLHRIP